MPLEHVLVELELQGLHALTDSLGRFRINGARPGIDTVRASFFRLTQSRIPVDLTSPGIHRVELNLSYAAFELADLVVKIDAIPNWGEKLTRRIESGLGDVISYDQMRRWAPARLVDFLRRTRRTSVRCPVGVRSEDELGSLDGSCVVLLRLPGRYCRPAVFVNERPVPDWVLETMWSEDVQAVEIYWDPWVPGEFYRYRNQCGAINIWTGFLAKQEPIKIRGRVTDENEEPIATADVYVYGTDLETLTDTDGVYSLVIPASEIDGKQHLLVAALTGYRSGQASVTLSGEDVTQDFQLLLDPIPSETVVGVGEAEEIRVSASKPWTKTGIHLKRGQFVVVTARGEARACGPPCEPCTEPQSCEPCSTEAESHDELGPRIGCGPGTGPRGSTATPPVTVSGLPWMALVGRMGEMSPFYIGSGLTFEALVDGELYLGVVDRPGQFRHNRGEFQVTIRLPRQPPRLAQTESGERP